MSEEGQGGGHAKAIMAITLMLGVGVAAFILISPSFSTASPPVTNSTPAPVLSFSVTGLGPQAEYAFRLTNWPATSTWSIASGVGSPAVCTGTVSAGLPAGCTLTGNQLDLGCGVTYVAFDTTQTIVSNTVNPSGC